MRNIQPALTVHIAQFAALLRDRQVVPKIRRRLTVIVAPEPDSGKAMPLSREWRWIVKFLSQAAGMGFLMTSGAGRQVLMRSPAIARRNHPALSRYGDL